MVWRERMQIRDWTELGKIPPKGTENADFIFLRLLST